MRVVGENKSRAPRVACVQDGARLHYAVPVALQRAGMLESMFTDWYCGEGSLSGAVSRAVTMMDPSLGKRMASRSHPLLPTEKVRSSPLLTLRKAHAKRRFRGQAYHQWCSEQTAKWIMRRGLGDANVLHGFVRNVDPSLLREAKVQGVRTVGDQIIAPAAQELAQLQQQQERFPGWERRWVLQDLKLIELLERQTWDALDHVTCASEYVQRHLIAQGVEPSRVSMLPYPIDATSVRALDRFERPGAVTVGFVGSVNLRKGVPYFLDVARAFTPSRVKFVMVGPVQIDPHVMEQHQGNVEIVGPVPRPEVLQWLDRFDMLLFPTTCEGSAGSVMEAMASGLPVITSPNAGSVARDGVDGFIHRYDDVQGMTERVEQLAHDAHLRREMGWSARKRAEEFSLAWYSDRLAELCDRLLGSDDEKKRAA
jgi:glycosyltransferase involved in cell wall biosynthesis